jgi:hypothetical protein
VIHFAQNRQGMVASTSGKRSEQHAEQQSSAAPGKAELSGLAEIDPFHHDWPFW